MQNLKLTIDEAQELLLMSQKTIFSWVDKGKLRMVKGSNGNFISIPELEAAQIRDFNIKNRRTKASRELAQGKTASIHAGRQNVKNVKEDDLENLEIKSLSNLANNLILELKELAFEAGRTKQLEIIRDEEKDALRFWEEKFFETNHALNEKKYEIAALQLQIAELQEQIEKSRPRSLGEFFSNMLGKIQTVKSKN